MKSQNRNSAASFSVLLDRLLDTVLLRLNNGDITERSLARVVGISQPQMHNVLKRKRRLQPELADRLLAQFELDISDLLAAEGLPTAVADSVRPPDPGGRELPRKGPGRAVLPRSGLGLIA